MLHQDITLNKFTRANVLLKLLLAGTGMLVIIGLTIFLIYGPAATNAMVNKYWHGSPATLVAPDVPVAPTTPATPTTPKPNTSNAEPQVEPTATSRVTAKNLYHGGIDKDGIPALLNPQFVAATETPFKDDALIIGITHNGVSKAYPYGILTWHEIVNDVIGDLPIAVTLCPLCDTNPIFIRKIDNNIVNFGVSDKLFQSCLVMYDHLSESLWSQPWGLGIAGERNNTVLQQIPGIKTTLGKWRAVYPDTVVLSTATGYNRDYNSYPYGLYATDNAIMFPVRNTEKLTASSKDIISYIYVHNNTRPKDMFSGNAYAINHNLAQQQPMAPFSFGDQMLRVVWDDKFDTVRFYNVANNQEIPASTAFNFVYPAFFE